MNQSAQLLDPMVEGGPGGEDPGRLQVCFLLAVLPWGVPAPPVPVYLAPASLAEGAGEVKFTNSHLLSLIFGIKTNLVQS